MYLRKEVVIPVGVGVASFAVGFVSGYIFKRLREQKNIEEQFEEVRHDQLRLEFDGNEIKKEVNKNLQQTNMVLNKFREHIGEPPQPVPTPMFINEINIEESQSHHPSGRANWEQIAQVVEEPITMTMSEREVDPNWDYDEELRQRGPDRPYVIHRDEFFSNEMDYDQTTISYYLKDNVLCDEQDKPIPNYERVVGVLKFGHGSLDPHICYMRSEKLMHEWEVLLDEGSFAAEVLGISAQEQWGPTGEMKHSNPRKFRLE